MTDGERLLDHEVMAGQGDVQKWKRAVSDHAAVGLVLHHDHHDVGSGGGTGAGVGARLWGAAGFTGVVRAGALRRTGAVVVGAGGAVLDVTGAAATAGSGDVDDVDVGIESRDCACPSTPGFSPADEAT